MKETPYTRARDTVFALNRLVKRGARLRKSERKAHFERDRETAHSLLSDPNIVGFGVGPKISGDKRDGSETCLVVFVRRKLPKFRLRNLMNIPKEMVLQTVGHKVRTDIQVWGGLAVAHALAPGDTVGDLAGNSGTLTLAVRQRGGTKPLILSCSHVMAACGDGHVGDGVESPANSGSGQNVVGSLLRFTRINPESPNNMVDAAVAKVLDGVSISNRIPGIGTPGGIRDLTLEGDTVANAVDVQRKGAVTSLQQGTIQNLHITTSIVYHQLPDDASARFVDLVQYDIASEEGDSGAPVLDTSSPPLVVGMHIASLPDGSSLFTHIRYVFDRMNVELLPERQG